MLASRQGVDLEAREALTSSSEAWTPDRAEKSTVTALRADMQQICTHGRDYVHDEMSIR